MSGTQRQSQAVHARTARGAGRRHARSRPETDSEAPLRLLPGRTLPMNREQEQRLVRALAELLAEWIEAHPEGLPAGLRTGRGCDLDGCSRAKEQS
jgi:hypothetical protein